MVFLLDSKGAKVRFSWFFYWIPKVQKFADLVDLVKSFLSRQEFFVAKIGFDAAENGPLKVCQQLSKS